MTDFDALWTSARPWLHVLPDTDGPHLPTSSEPADGKLVVELDGRKMRDFDSLMTEFGREFHFPDYFGRNWAAFNECMRDLKWLPARAYLVIIRNADQVLICDPLDRPTFFRIIKDVGKRWSWEFVPDGEGGGTDVPFNVALMCPSAEVAKLKEKLGENAR